MAEALISPFYLNVSELESKRKPKQNSTISKVDYSIETKHQGFAPFKNDKPSAEKIDHQKAYEKKKALQFIESINRKKKLKETLGSMVYYDFNAERVGKRVPKMESPYRNFRRSMTEGEKHVYAVYNLK